MSPADASRPSRRSDEDVSVLVCGRCETVLPGRYEHSGEADEAADEHVEQAHPDQGAVIVVPAPARLARVEPDELVHIAVRAQARIDDPGDGTGNGARGDGRGEAIPS